MRNLIITLIASLFSFQSFSALCIAHRGNNARHLENSFASIVSAYEIGSHGIEFDVQHTSDGVPLVIHDKKLKRTALSKENHKCRLKKKIKKLTYLHIKNKCKLKNGEPIPTLESVLEYLQDKPVLKFVELKDMPSIKTMELIEKYLGDSASEVRILSFKKEALVYFSQMKELYPKLKDVRLLHLYPFFIAPRTVFDLNIRYTKWSFKRLLKHKSKERGVWTVDNPEKIGKLLNQPIDYVTTNRPKTCLRIFHDN